MENRVVVREIPCLPGILDIAIPQGDCPDRHAYAAVGDRGVDLIDVCGPNVKSIMQALQAYGVDCDRIRTVRATHAHNPQVGGYLEFRRRFADCNLALHANDWVALTTGDPRLLEDDSAEWQPVVNRGWLEPLEEGEVITLGDYNATVWHTPGHTRGSVCLQAMVSGIRVVFSGDTLFGALPQWNVFPSMLDLQVSAARLANEPFDVFLPAWGMGGDLPKPKQLFLAKLPYLGRMLNPWKDEHQAA